MKRLGRAFLPYLLDFAPDFARDVLNQRTSQENVQALHAEANGENGFVFSESMFEKREIRLFATGIGLSAFQMPRSMKARRLNIRGTSRQHKSIERTRGFFQLVRRECERYFYRFATCASDAVAVPFVFVALPCKFFFSCAIGDANSRFLAEFGWHGMPILPLSVRPSNQQKDTAQERRRDEVKAMRPKRGK